MKKPRKNSLVKYTGKNAEEYPEGDLLFLGEIPNMPSHCVVAGLDGRITWGWHTDNFVELTEDEV